MLLWLMVLVVAAGARSPFGRRRAGGVHDETLIDLSESPALTGVVIGEALGVPVWEGEPDDGALAFDEPAPDPDAGDPAGTDSGIDAVPSAAPEVVPEVAADSERGRDDPSDGPAAELLGAGSIAARAHRRLPAPDDDHDDDHDDDDHDDDDEVDLAALVASVDEPPERAPGAVDDAGGSPS
jgi:hypothetical protein